MTASTAAKHGLGIKMASSDCATYLNQFQPTHGLIKYTNTRAFVGFS